MAFPSTHWSLIGAVSGEKSAEQRQALELLSTRYRRPAYLHIRRKGYGHDEAEDLVQSFFANWLEADLFGKADPTRGRFRSFFLTCLDNFLANSRRMASAQRRRPEGGFADDVIDDLTDGGSPEELFWRAYASDLTHETLEDVAARFEQRDMASHVQAFRRWVVGPVLDGAERPSQRTLAREIDVSEKQLSNMLITVRRAFRKALESRVREYAANEVDVAEEVHDLMGYIRFDDEG